MKTVRAQTILDSLDRIRGMVEGLTDSDGTVSGVDHKLEITLELCEKLLRDGQDQEKHSRDTNLID